MNRQFRVHEEIERCTVMTSDNRVLVTLREFYHFKISIVAWHSE